MTYEWNDPNDADIVDSLDDLTDSETIQPARKVKKPDTKSIKNTNDPLYDDVDEAADARNGGIKLCPILPKVTRPCFSKDDVEKKKKMVRCLYSAHCKQVWQTWPRDKTRVLRHASYCGYLAKHQQGKLTQDALRELAIVDPKAAKQLRINFPGKRGRSTEEDSQAATVPLKRSRTEPAIGSKSSDGVKIVDRKLKPIEPTTIYKAEGQKQLEKNVNYALVKLFVCCGIPPNVLSSTEFQEFCEAMNMRYVVPSRSRLEESLIPMFAAQVRLSAMESTLR